MGNRIVPTAVALQAHLLLGSDITAQDAVRVVRVAASLTLSRLAVVTRRNLADLRQLPAAAPSDALLPGDAAPSAAFPRFFQHVAARCRRRSNRRSTCFGGVDVYSEKAPRDVENRCIPTALACATFFRTYSRIAAVDPLRRWPHVAIDVNYCGKFSAEKAPRHVGNGIVPAALASMAVVRRYCRKAAVQSVLR